MPPHPQHRGCGLGGIIRYALCQASIAHLSRSCPYLQLGMVVSFSYLPRLGSTQPATLTGPAAYVKSDLSYWCSHASCQREWARPPWRQPRQRPQATRHRWHYPMPMSGPGPDGQAAWGYPPGVAQGGDCHHNKQRLLATLSKPQACQDRRVLCAGQPSARHLHSSLQSPRSSSGKK